MQKPRNQTIIIRIKDKQRKITINKKTLVRLLKKILRIKKIKEAEVSLLFAGKGAIRRLNKSYRKEDRPTDVLSFSMLVHKEPPFLSGVLGDIVICPEVVQKFSRIYKNTLKQELYLCLIHGVLHLLGYEDTTEKARAVMAKEQERILTKVASRK